MEIILRVKEILESFEQALLAAGLRTGKIIGDGKLHRCPTDGKPQSLDGAYLLHLDEPASGWWQNYRTGESSRWTAKEQRSMTTAEREKLKVRIEQDHHNREKAKAESHAVAALMAQEILAKAAPCDGHPYLERKGVKPCPGLKVDADGALVVPVNSPVDNKPMSLQFIPPSGPEKRFLAGGRKRGGFFVIKGEKVAVGSLFICEGLATGLSVSKATKHSVLVAFNAGNLEHVANYVRQKYPEREIVLCADDDHATDGNPGMKAARAAAKAVNGRLAVPRFKEPAGKSDFNDLHTAEGLEAVWGCLLGVSGPRTPRDETDDTPTPANNSGKHVPALGNSFSLRNDGVYFMELDKDGVEEYHWVCSPLRVLAQTRNGEGQAWGRLLELMDPEGNFHQWAMPSSLMAGSGDVYRSELLSMGLSLAPGSKGKQRLDLYLSTTRVDTFARCVERIGWHDGVFVLPDKVYCEHAGEMTVAQGIPTENAFRQKSTLSDWQERIGRACVGNSRLVLSVCAALAGPLLHPLGAESGGLHLVGGSSLGKTTALRVAGSVLGGGHGGFIKQWRATDNGLEGIAAAHCDTLLCLDEMGQANSRVVSETAYMLANETGKVRANREGMNRRVQKWRLLFLSTGEVTLSDKIVEEGRGRAKAGQAVRVVDIDADAGAGLGLFETLHGAESADLFARQLKDASASCYGTVFRAWLEALTADLENITSQAKALVQDFEQCHSPAGANGQVLRVCGRFALLAAAGELGIQIGILPWSAGEAVRGVSQCFLAWLDQRGGIGAAEVTAGVEQVRQYIQAHGASRFEDLDTDDKHIVNNRAGYRRRENGTHQFLVYSETFRKELCVGFNVGAICAELKRQGVLLSESGRNTRTARTPDGVHRFYILSSSIIGGNSGNTGNTHEKTDESCNHLPEHEVVTPVTSGNKGAAVTTCNHLQNTKWKQESTNNIRRVPTVTTVTTENKPKAESFCADVANGAARPDVVTI